VPMICISFVLFREREIWISRAAVAFAAAATPLVLRNSNNPILSIVHLILNFLCSFYFKPLFKTSLKVIKDEVRLIQVKRARSDNKIINYFFTMESVIFEGHCRAMTNRTCANRDVPPLNCFARLSPVKFILNLV